MNITTPLLTAVLPAMSAAHLVESQVPSKAARPATTEVMVILTARQGVTRERLTADMPQEIQAW